MPSSVDTLPPDAILVHIGPHKTGTTALQSMLDRGREAMAEHGVLYPLTKGAHHDEARSLRQLAAGWAHDGEATPDPAIWDELVRVAKAATGRVVISSEFFAQSDQAQRAKLVADLGPERLYLIMAARNPASIAVSTWQQILRQGHNHTLDSWLQREFRRDGSEGKQSSFWNWADAALLAHRWAAEVGEDRFRVLILDERDRLGLPRAFEQLLGLPEGLLSGQEAKSNRSLTAPEAELFHRVLDRIKGEFSWDEYSKIVRSGMLVRLVENRKPPSDEARCQMPAWAIEQGDRDARDIVERLQDLSHATIGDVDALLRGPQPADDAEAITDVPVDMAADALAGTMEAAVRHLRRLEANLARAQKRNRQLQRAAGVDDLTARQLARALAGRVRRRARRVATREG